MGWSNGFRVCAKATPLGSCKLAPIELSHLFQTHRSIRKYKPDPVPQELIETVCHEAIIGGSSSGNLNAVSIVLTREPEMRQKLYELHFEQEMILQAPLVITFCADWWRTREWLRLRGARDNFNNLLGYHVAAYDAMLTAQNVCLGFQNAGLGICYMGTTLFRLRDIAELLQLPETCVPVTTIVVGYPDEDPAKRDRLPLDAFLHDEVYHCLDSTEIDEVFREREVRGWDRYMSYPGMRELAAEKGITTLAQFYTSEIKYSPEYFEQCSKEMLAFLKAKGFLD
ncbi:MAG: nitroreductase family protein [Fimbriimonadales bacterium]